jgi:hypothetical protein
MINKTYKIRIGVILGLDIDQKAVPPLKFLILHLNSLQTYFEYEFLPTIQDPTLTELATKEILDRQQTRKSLLSFVDRYENFLNRQRKSYKLEKTEQLPDAYILISLIRFQDEYYLTGVKKLGIIALGNWKRLMAPPSILEFLLTMVLIESVYLLGWMEDLSHLGTKGCLFDFNAELENARYGVLQSFICSNCRNALANAGHLTLADELVKISTKSWLGVSTDPSSPAGIISNFNYDLFLTKGLKPTFGERTLQILQTDGIKELIKLIAAIILAGALFYLQWKK